MNEVYQMMSEFTFSGMEVVDYMNLAVLDSWAVVNPINGPWTKLNLKTHFNTTYMRVERTSAKIITEIGDFYVSMKIKSPIVS